VFVGRKYEKPSGWTNGGAGAHDWFEVGGRTDPTVKEQLMAKKKMGNNVQGGVW